MGIQSFPIATPTPVQTTPVQGTSIAQMVNAANGIQQYQQSQQLNPLQIKQAQMAIEQAQQINPLAVEKAQAELETAKTGSQQAKQNYLVSGEDYSRKMINALPPIDDYVDKTGEVNQKALSRSLDIIRKSAYAVGLPNHPSNLLGQLEDAVATKDYNKYEELRNRVAKSSGTTSEQYASKFPVVGFQSLGGTVQPVATGNPNIAETTPGTKIGNGLNVTPAPLGYGQRYEATGRVDQNNNPTAYVRDAQGNILGEVTIPAGVNPQQITQPSGAQKGNMQQGGAQPTVNQPPTNAPLRLAPFETQATVDLERKRQLDTIAQRQTVAQSTYNYNQIIDLADKSITGVGAQQIAKLSGGYAGIPWKADEASNLQQLGHFMALQTGNLAQQAGLDTDQGRSIAQDQIGTTNWTSDAIKATARTNRALVTGIDLYGLGMNNAIKKAGNNPLAGRDYTEKWSSVADIDALKYYDAIKNKDKTEIKQIVDKVGGPESKGYADLITRYNKIYSLVTGGQ